jgi:hypothetical protein
MNSINSIMREIKRFSEWKRTAMKKADEGKKINSGGNHSMWPGAMRGYGPITIKLERDNYGFTRA